MATQNPIEFEGTFPLPEAQLDRFLLRMAVGYPDMADEHKILINLRRQHPITSLQPAEFLVDRTMINGAQRLLTLQKLVWEVHVDESLQDYILRLVTTTREHPDLALGGSPRASLSLFKSAQALAAVKGRDYVIPDDIKRLATYVLPHRLIVRPEATLRGRTPERILKDILEKTELSLDEVGR